MDEFAREAAAASPIPPIFVRCVGVFWLLYGVLLLFGVGAVAGRDLANLKRFDLDDYAMIRLAGLGAAFMGAPLAYIGLRTARGRARDTLGGGLLAILLGLAHWFAGAIELFAPPTAFAIAGALVLSGLTALALRSRYQAWRASRPCPVATNAPLAPRRFPKRNDHVPVITAADLADESPDQSRPSVAEAPFPESLTYMGMAWLFAGLVMVYATGFMVVRAFGVVLDPLWVGAGARYSFAMLIPGMAGLGFCFVGVQTARGAVADVLGNSVASIAVGALFVGIAVVVPGVKVIGLLGAAGGGLVLLGLAAICRRRKYLAWRATRHAVSQNRTDGGDFQSPLAV